LIAIQGRATKCANLRVLKSSTVLFLSMYYLHAQVQRTILRTYLCIQK
jgi:hypothetical protein